MGSKWFSKLGIALAGIAMAVGVGVGLGQKEFKKVEADVTIESTPETEIGAGTYVISITDSDKDFYWTFPGTNSGLLKSSHILLTQYGQGKTVTSITGVPETCVVTLTAVEYQETTVYKISALDNNSNVSYIGYKSSTDLKCTTSAEDSNNAAYYWTIANGSSSGLFTITNVGTDDRILKFFSNATNTDIRAYNTNSNTQDFSFYSATIVNNDPAFDISAASLTFKAGADAQTLTASNFINFTDTPTLTASFKFGNIATYSISNNVVAVTPKSTAQIGNYKTDVLTVTATYNEEVATKTVNITVNPQTVSVDKSTISVVSNGSAVVVTATPSNFDDAPTYSWTIVSDDSNIISSLGNSSTAAVSVNPSSTNTTASATIRVTATYSSNLTQTATADVTVNMVVTSKHYDIDFSCSESTTAINSTTWATYAGGGASSLTLNSTGYTYPYINAIRFGSSSKIGSVSLSAPGGQLIKRVILHAASYVSTNDVTDANSAMKVNSSAAQATTKNYAYYLFDLETAANTIVIENNSTSTGRCYVDDIIFIAEGNNDEIGAYGYAMNLLNSTAAECAAKSVSTSTWSTLSGAWTTMGTNYTNSQTFFLGHTANESGNVIQQALARYDYIVGKYNKKLHLDGYTDFMSRDPAPVASVIAGSTITRESNNDLLIAIIIIAGISTLAIGGYFFIRRKHQ